MINSLEIEPLVFTERRTALTDSQWDTIKDLFDCRRKRKHAIRGIIDAVLYVVDNDTHWRMLPKNYAPWQTVYYYFDKWRKTGVWQRVLEALPDDIRQKALASSFVSPFPTVDLKVYHSAIQPRRAQIHSAQINAPAQHSEQHSTKEHSTGQHSTEQHSNQPRSNSVQLHTVEAGSSLSPAQRQERRYAWVLRDFLEADDDSTHNQAA